MTPTNPVNPQWEDVKQRSPIMRKNTVWQEHFDPQNNCNWYYNTVTGESTWEKPKDWVDESWDQIQQRSPVTNMSGLWQQYYDPTYNCNWYYNTRTNQSTWEKPAGWSENGKNNGGKKKILKVAEKDEEALGAIASKCALRIPVFSMSGASPLLIASLLDSSTACAFIVLNIFKFNDLASTDSNGIPLDCK